MELNLPAWGPCRASVVTTGVRWRCAPPPQHPGPPLCLWNCPQLHPLHWCLPFPERGNFKQSDLAKAEKWCLWCAELKWNQNASSYLFKRSQLFSLGENVSLLWSYPRETAELGTPEFQMAPVLRPLACREAAQGAAAILQDVRQLGLQPLNGGSCHGGRTHGSRFRGPHVPPFHTRPP